ncbi:hypothetical protein D3C87_1316650 [compost metagenome]
MGNIHRTHTLDVDVAGDEERICLGDHDFGRVIQLIEVLRGTRCRIRQGYRTELP